MRGKLVAIVIAFSAAAVVAQAGGIVSERTFYSDALGEDRTVLVYLPEDYATSGLDYTVVYYLHGAGGEPGDWYLTDYFPVLDQMVADGWVDPAIVIEPDSAGCLPPQEWQNQGLTDRVFHYHANSALLGKNEDYLAEDLVAWVDATYRTITDRDHRPIVARSMGGHGAMRLTMLHPETFGGASIDAGYMAIVEGDLPNRYVYLLSGNPGPPYTYAPTMNFYAAQIFAICAAFTPNMSNPPWHVDFILDENGAVDPSVEQRLLAQSPPALVEDYAGSEYPLDLFLRIGDQDEFADTFWPVIDALEDNDVPHLVRGFEGSHWVPDTTDKIAVQMSYFMPIKATADITPRVADPRLYPQLLRVAVELPGDLEVTDIDCSTLTLIDIDDHRMDCPISCTGTCEVSDLNGNGRNDLSVWLPCDAMARAAVSGGAAPGDQIELTLRGELNDDRFFQATDTVTLATDMVASAAVD